MTTGSEFIGYFISCDGMEPEDARSLYSETLLCLPEIGVRYHPPDGAHAGTRVQFGLPPDRRIYLCPQSLCKIHPDNDALFIRSSSATRRLIVFFEGQATGQTLAFASRLERALRRRNVPPRQQYDARCPRLGIADRHAGGPIHARTANRCDVADPRNGEVDCKRCGAAHHAGPASRWRQTYRTKICAYSQRLAEALRPQ